jgi:PAS domain S-box-containing protein
MTHPYERLEPEAMLNVRLQRWSRYFAIIVFIVGILVLAGWQWDIPMLKRPLPHLTAMNPLTALCFLSAAISFLLLSGAFSSPLFPARSHSIRILAARVLAGVVVLAGIIKLAWIFTGIGLPIDRLLFAERIIADSQGNLSSQMSANTSFSFVLTGISLLSLHLKTKRRLPAQYPALLALLMGLFSMIGYLYQVKAFYGAFTYVPMALHTAVSFVLLSVAILFSDPGSSFMRQLTSTYMGGHTARSLLPLIIILPVILGYLRLLAYWKGLISTEFGVAALVSAIVFTFIIIIWYNIRLLNQKDEQKKAAEDSLRETEQRFELLVSNIKDYAIFMLDPSGHVLSWNEGAERIKGYKKAEIIGTHLSVFYTAEDVRQGKPEHSLSIAKERGNFENEGWRVRKDGTVFWANTTFTSIYDQGGKILGFAKMTRDVTERKRLEQQLREFNEALEEQVKKKTAELTGVFERITDAFIAVDKDFCYTYLNKKAGELIRHEPASLIGKCVWDVFPEAIGSTTYHAFNKAMSEQHDIVNIDYYPPLGLWQENHFYPSPDGLSLFIRNITAQKKSEKAITDYKYALDQSSIVSITDQQGVIRYVNENFCSISQFTGEELIGHTHSIVSSGDHPAAVTKSMWTTISGGRVWKGEFRNKAKDGSIYCIDMTIIPFLDEKGEPYEYLALGSNITERKKAEELLEQSYQDIRQLASHLQDVREEERAGIAREIHDELGQQLTGLKMDLSWISKRKVLEDDIQIKNKVDVTMDLLDTTIKTVRRIATDLRPSILDDLGLIAAIEWQSQEFQKRSGIPTEFICTVEEFNYSSATSIGLFRICQESLTNVARHAEASNVCVTLQEQENKFILLKIEDNGKGFEFLKTGHKKTLGLLGMKERTLMMGGDFSIDSHPGKGTILSVTVPLTPELI